MRFYVRSSLFVGFGLSTGQYTRALAPTYAVHFRNFGITKADLISSRSGASTLCIVAWAIPQSSHLQKSQCLRISDLPHNLKLPIYHWQLHSSPPKSTVLTPTCPIFIIYHSLHLPRSLVPLHFIHALSRNRNPNPHDRWFYMPVSRLSHESDASWVRMGGSTCPLNSLRSVWELFSRDLGN